MTAIRNEFTRKEQDALAEYLSHIPEQDRSANKVFVEWDLKFKSNHPKGSWKEHFRRGGKEYITKKILQIERDRARVSNFKKALSAGSNNNNDPLQPIAGPSGTNSNTKKRQREVTPSSEEEEEEKSEKSTKRTFYKKKDKRILAKALRKAESRKETRSSVYQNMAKKYPAHTATSWQTFHRDNKDFIQEIMDDLDLDVVQSSSSKQKKKKQKRKSNSDNDEEEEEENVSNRSISGSVQPSKKKKKNLKDEPVKAISEDEEDEEEEVASKQKQVEKAVLPVVTPDIPVATSNAVKGKGTYVGFGPEDDTALINTIVKAESEGFALESVWSTLASMYPAHTEQEWEKRWTTNILRLKPMVTRKIQAKNPVPKKDMAIQVANFIPKPILPVSNAIASTSNGNGTGAYAAPLSSIRRKPIEEAVGEDVDELAEDSQFNHPLPLPSSLVNKNLVSMNGQSPVKTSSSSTTINKDSSLQAQEQMITPKPNQKLPAPIILNNNLLTTVQTPPETIVPVIPTSSSQSLPSPYIKSIKPPTTTNTIPEVRFEMEVDGSDSEIRTEQMDEDDKRIEATLKAVLNPAKSQIQPPPRSLEIEFINTTIANLNRELKPKSRPLYDNSNFLASLRPFRPKAFKLPSNLPDPIEVPRTRNWNEAIPEKDWNPRILALKEFAVKQKESIVEGGENDWEPLTTDAIQLELELLEFLLVERKFLEEDKKRTELMIQKSEELSRLDLLRTEWEEKEAVKALKKKELIDAEEERFRLDEIRFEKEEELRIMEVKKKLELENEKLRLETFRLETVRLEAFRLAEVAREEEERRQKAVKAAADELEKLELLKLEAAKKAKEIQELAEAAKLEQERLEQIELARLKEEEEIAAKAQELAQIQKQKEQEEAEAIRYKKLEKGKKEKIIEEERFERARSLQAKNESRVLQDQNSSQERERKRLVEGMKLKAGLSQSTNRPIISLPLQAQPSAQLQVQPVLSSSPAPPDNDNQIVWTAGSPGLPDGLPLRKQNKRPRASLSVSEEPNTSLSSRTLKQTSSPPRDPSTSRIRSPKEESVVPKEEESDLTTTDANMTIEELKLAMKTLAEKYKIKKSKVMKLYFACSANIKVLDVALKYYTTDPRPEELSAQVDRTVWSRPEDVAVLEGPAHLKAHIEKTKGRGSVAWRKSFLKNAGRTSAEQLSAASWPFA